MHSETQNRRRFIDSQWSRIWSRFLGHGSGLPKDRTQHLFVAFRNSSARSSTNGPDSV